MQRRPSGASGRLSSAASLPLFSPLRPALKWPLSVSVLAELVRPCVLLLDGLQLGPNDLGLSLLGDWLGKLGGKRGASPSLRWAETEWRLSRKEICNCARDVQLANWPAGPQRKRKKHDKKLACHCFLQKALRRKLTSVCLCACACDRFSRPSARVATCRLASSPALWTDKQDRRTAWRAIWQACEWAAGGLACMAAGGVRRARGRRSAELRARVAVLQLRRPASELAS